MFESGEHKATLEMLDLISIWDACQEVGSNLNADKQLHIRYRWVGEVSRLIRLANHT